ncbi:hypothetical protein ACFJGX_12790 [Hydrogenophaga sp. UC242_50]|jgi:hypothetical protein|uniref:hypothetical protein n=1 Tax=unclassified Hydrogenophaga TaxID=2610897 RepID=UPI0036D3EAAD
MKLFGRKPSPQAAASAAVPTCTPDPEHMPFFPKPVSTQRMWFSLHHSTSAELKVSTRRTKVKDAPYDVVLQACKAPLETEWTLSAEQARELAARLLDAAADCGEFDNATFSLRWD